MDNGTVPYGISMDENEQSPFYVEGNLGKIHIVLTGGEYDNIVTEQQAQDRAEYELYLRCKLQDQVTINCVPIYWLDVNWLIEITLPNKQGTEETHQYIIKSINTTLGVNGTQSINMMRYYPLYPFEEDNVIYNNEPSPISEEPNPINDISDIEPIKNIDNIKTIDTINVIEPIKSVEKINDDNANVDIVDTIDKIDIKEQEQIERD